MLALRMSPMERFSSSASGLSRHEIEHQDAQVLGLLQIGKYLVHPGHATQVGLVAEFGINRHEIIDARELHGMAAVIEDGDIGGTGGTGKADGGIVHAGFIEIDPQNGLEAGAL